MSRIPEDLHREMDSFGLMALGALSYSEALTALLAIPGHRNPAAPPTRTLLFAALGAVSLCRTVQRRLHEACPASPADEVRGPALPIRELLR